MAFVTQGSPAVRHASNAVSTLGNTRAWTVSSLMMIPPRISFTAQTAAFAESEAETSSSIAINVDAAIPRP